jgi:hypothetical protein
MSQVGRIPGVPKLGCGWRLGKRELVTWKQWQEEAKGIRQSEVFGWFPAPECIICSLRDTVADLRLQFQACQ